MSVIKKFFGWLLLGPIAIVALLLAVANRTPVVLSWNPFEASDGLEMPLFVLPFVFFALGAVCGGFAVWMAQGRWRRTAKEQRAELKKLKNEAASRTDALPVLTR